MTLTLDEQLAEAQKHCTGCTALAAGVEVPEGQFMQHSQACWRYRLAVCDRTITELRGYALHSPGCDKKLASSPIAWDLLACSCGLQALLDKHEAMNSPGGAAANEVQEQA